MERWKRTNALGGAMREIVFGLEDSLVSTLGAVAGVAVGSGNRYIVIMTGLVLVVVEAISMAAGSYLSTQSAQEVSQRAVRQDGERYPKHSRMTSEIHPAAAALVMGVVYVFGGTLVFLPYFFFSIVVASVTSVVVAVLALFLLGVWKAKIADVPRLRSGLQMVAVSLLAAALGMTVGRFASTTLG